MFISRIDCSLDIIRIYEIILEAISKKLNTPITAYGCHSSLSLSQTISIIFEMACRIIEFRNLIAKYH